ncbi:4'-phosphopantetheinyl transferase superfamily protein [Streptomyces sp. NPDC005181]|uniref:4'-phosphopantetheinyl transferase family protein n=1 Tax=Streptomyces sp. NPDC005181 TaxID=3156869 RepID=UPI00339ED088
MNTYVNRLGSNAPQTGSLSAGASVAVWALDTTSGVVGGHTVAEALPMLDAVERDRAERLLREGDRHRYLASHVGLRVLLGGYLGLTPAEVSMVREKCPCCGGPHGRPAVDGGALHFSLSHSDDVAYLAFAQVPVGVDVEGIPGAAAVADVLTTLHPAETAELTALPEPDRRAAMGRVWSRKEAYLKATGTGLALGLAEPYVGSAHTPAVVPGWTLTDLPAPPGYAAALALRTPDRASTSASA